ncbi:MAG: transglycosylase SLT domain-containing protein [Rhodocyclaceae bacterium]|nr:transglycosylase SLT domain-containing protein [Rhodocyclaceae bacterium]
MSEMIETRPATVRLAAFFGAFVQSLLMLAGAVMIAGLFALSQGDRRIVEQLSTLLPDNGETTEMVAYGLPDETGEIEADEVLSLSPRMQAALDSVARRYRVAAGPLAPIFSAAEAAGREYRLDPLLIVSVIAVESRFNPFSESVMGAQGLMQVMPRYHQDKLPEGAAELAFFDPVLNVRIGTRILRDAIRRNGSLEAGLQQFAGALDDTEQRYASKVLAEKARLEAAAQRSRMREA